MTITFEELIGVPGHAEGVAGLRVRAFGYTEPGVFGRNRLRLRAVGTASATLVVATPQPPLSCVHTLRLGAKVGTASHGVVNGDALLRLNHRGFAGKPGTISGRSWLRLKAFGAQGAGNTGYAMLVAQSPEVSSYGDQWFGIAREDIQLDARAARLYAAVSRSPIGLGSVTNGTFNGTGVSEDILAFGARLTVVRHVLAEDGITFATLLSGQHTLLGRALARVMLSGEASNYGEALQVVASAVVLGEVTEWLRLAEAADSLQVTDKVEQLYTAFTRVLERLTIAAQTSGSYTLTVLLRDGFALGSRPTHQAELAAQIADCLGLGMALSFDTGEFLAWVMNTESRALSTYSQYPFNSFAKIGGRYYGAHAGGIARLGGRDDMGEPIRARLRLGMSDLGDRLEKSFSDVFFGMAADGQMLLKTIFVDKRSGEKNMAIYKVLARPAAVSRETRAKIGKGMKAVDWDFEIENVDGADFDLQTIQFYPTQMSRRTRG